MSYLVSTGYRKPTFTFTTNEEATRFNDELYAKNKVHGSIVLTDCQPNYLYDSECKLRRI